MNEGQIPGATSEISPVADAVMQIPIGQFMPSEQRMEDRPMGLSSAGQATKSADSGQATKSADSGQATKSADSPVDGPTGLWSAPVDGPMGLSSAPVDGPRLLALPSLALTLLFLGAIAVTLDYENAKRAPQEAQTAAAAAALYAFDGIPLEAKSAIVQDLLSGRTLYSKNPDVQLPLASLTKVALVLAISEALSPDQVITIPYDTAPRGSAERLAKGEKWTVKNIIDFTLIASSNAGAEILASAADTSLSERFPDAPEGSAALWRMNRMARELGLEHTYFLNASGLDMSATLAGAYGSARDMSKLFAYAADAGQGAFGGTAEGGLLFTSPDGSAKTKAFNTNEAIGDIPGLIMGKTGTTDLAGGNLAIVFEVGPVHPVVAVVLGGTREGRFNDMKLLIERTQQAISSEQ